MNSIDTNFNKVAHQRHLTGRMDDASSATGFLSIVHLRKSCSSVVSGILIRRCAALMAVSCLNPLPALGAGKDDAGGTLGVYFENDLFANTDRYYTNGFKLSWSSQDLEQYSDSRYASPLLPLFNMLPYINETAYQKTWFTHSAKISTPRKTPRPPS